MKLKQKIYDHYLRLVNEKLASLVQVLTDLKESSANETKSTAGDKHETALAMLQIEQANVGSQLHDIRNKKATLEKTGIITASTRVINGSLVNTNKGHFYISVALGKLTIEGINVTAISPQSPLGIKLMGLSAGDVAEVNNNIYVIEGIE